MCNGAKNEANKLTKRSMIPKVRQLFIRESERERKGFLDVNRP